MVSWDVLLAVVVVVVVVLIVLCVLCVVSFAAECGELPNSTLLTFVAAEHENPPDPFELLGEVRWVLDSSQLALIMSLVDSRVKEGRGGEGGDVCLSDTLSRGPLASL